MQNTFFNRIKSTISTGFGSDASVEGDRLIKPNGTFNVKKTGLSFKKKFSVYQWLIHLNWFSFLVFTIFIYVLINSFFATMYYLVGTETIRVYDSTGFYAWLKAFHFSAQTLTTVGYGAMSPTGSLSLIISSLEAFVGLASFALLSGLAYGRFSKPRHNFIFSKNALIAPFEDGKAFMFRVSNARSSEMTEPEVKVTLSMIKEVNGVRKRDFYPLNLEFNKVTFLPMSWTVVHPIYEDSPFELYTLEELRKAKAEILILVKGFEEIFMQQVNAQKSYVCDDIVKNAKFKPMYSTGSNQSTIVNYKYFDAYNLLDKEEKKEESN